MLIAEGRVKYSGLISFVALSSTSVDVLMYTQVPWYLLLLWLLPSFTPRQLTTKIISL